MYIISLIGRFKKIIENLKCLHCLGKMFAHKALLIGCFSLQSTFNLYLGCLPSSHINFNHN